MHFKFSHKIKRLFSKFDLKSIVSLKAKIVLNDLVERYACASFSI